MGTLRRYKHFILLVTFPVLILFLSNSLINKHNHFVRGFVYSHAHPFNKEKDNNQYPYHNHTDAELVLLGLLTDIDMLIICVLFSLALALWISKLLPGISHDIHRGPALPSYSPRGPPLYNL